MSFFKKLKEFINPCKSDEESQLEEAHLNITKLINNDPENPYLATNSALSSMALEHIRNSRREATIRIILIFLVIVFAGMTVFLAASKKIIPYVIEVNQNGQVFDLNQSLKSAPSDIKDKLAITNIADFVRYVYSVSPDGNINNLYQSKAYAFSKGSASTFLQDYFATHDTKTIASKYIVSININYILPESESTIKVSWTESKRDVQSNSLISKQKYVGQFTYSWDVRSGNELISQLNPLGFFVNFIVTNKDYS